MHFRFPIAILLIQIISKYIFVPNINYKITITFRTHYAD